MPDPSRQKQERTGKFASKDHPAAGKGFLNLTKTCDLWVFVASFFIFSTTSFANPVLNQVTSGQVAIHQTDATTTVNQTSNKAIIDWRSFNIGKKETTRFNQPNAHSVTLNRIDPNQGASQIYGRLSANGHLILVNQAGLFFGPGSRVDVAGLIASSADISNANFLSGNYLFNQPSLMNSSIINQGTIVAAEHGLVALIGNNVENDGAINARLGNVILASGSTFTLDLAGDQLVSFAVSGASAAGSVSNAGIIAAAGGTVRMSANAAADVISNVINMSGVIEARSVSKQNGTIILSGGEHGKVQISGTLNASGKYRGENGGSISITGDEIALDTPSFLNASGNARGGRIYIFGNHSGVHGSLSAEGGSAGGWIETSGHTLDISQIHVNTSATRGQNGMWLLDPYNVTISTSATSNDSLSSNTYTPSATGANILYTDLQTALGSNNITITTTGAGAETGNITWNSGAAISWSSGNTLTLNTSATTAGSITLNSAITNTSSGGLTLQAGSSSGTITISAPISLSSGALALTAAGGTTFASAGTISAGSLSLSGGGTDHINTATITTTGAQTYNNAVILDAAPVLTSGTLTMAAVSMGANILTINTSAADSAITGNITGSSSLKFNTTDTTSGTLTLSGSNSTYSGGTTIGSSANTPSNKLIVTTPSGLGTGTVTVNYNSTLNLNTGGTTANNLLLNGYGIGGSSSGIGALLGSGTSTVSGQITLSKDNVNTLASRADTAIGVTSGDTLTITGKITDGASNKNFNKVGNGTLVLSNAQATANTISNGTVVTTVSAGTLEITNTTALASALNSSTWAAVSVSYGATFRMNISTQGSYSGTPVSTVQNQIKLFGYGVDSTGATGTSSTGLGSLQGTGNSIYNVLSTGVLLSNNGTTTHSSANDTYISVPNSGDVLSITGAITDGNANKSFTKIGSGTLSISGANRLTSSTGSIHTVVSAGTLQVTSSTALLNEAATSGYFVDVNAGSTLAIATSNVSFVNPINLAGTLTNTNNNTLSGNITLTSSTSPVISSDSSSILTLSGTLNGATALTLSGAGTISLSGVIGSTSAPTSLTSNVTTNINTTSITTSGAQTYNNAVSLGASGVTTLTSSGAGGITFSSTLDGSQGLAIANSSGTITFGNRVGNTTPLTSLVIGTSDPVTMNTDLVLTSGQTYGSTLSWSNTLTLNASGSTSGSITLNSGITNSTGSLTLKSGLTTGTIVINAPISLAAGTLTLTASNTASSITTGSSGTISVAGFNLTQGQWNQTTASLPAFSATNFQLNSGNGSVSTVQFIRATSGTGASGTPYLLSDIYGVQGIGSNSTTLGYAYQLNSNIDASGTANWNSGAGFVPVGSTSTPYSGIFNGNSKTLSNLYIVRTGTTNVGLFAVNSGTLQNIGLLAGTTGLIEGGNNVGALAGTNNSGGQISSAYSSLPVKNLVTSGTTVLIGGLVGTSAGTIDSSYTTGSVSNIVTFTSGTLYMGGLVGSSTGTLSNSWSSASVRSLASENGANTGGEIDAAGLCATCSGTVSNVYSQGTVSIINNTNFGSTLGSLSLSGLITRNSATLSNSYSTTPVTIDISNNTLSGNLRVGGLVSVGNGDTISGSYNTGALNLTLGTTTGSDIRIGGLYGNTTGTATLTTSYNTGAVTLSGSSISGIIRVGGIAGGWTPTNTDTSLSDTYNTGNVSVSATTLTPSSVIVGGLVGNSGTAQTFSRIMNRGDVSLTATTLTVSTDARVGGIAGAAPTLVNAYNTGTISITATSSSGTLFEGGVAATALGISNSYNTGRVTGGTSIGSISASSGAASANYWDSQTSGLASGSYGTPKLTSAMMTDSTFSGWDFTTTWGIISGQSYPYLNSFYSSTPRAISGSAASLGAGQTIQLAVSGSNISTSNLIQGSVTTGANGFYYFLEPNGTIANSVPVIAYASGGSTPGSAISQTPASGGSMTGLNVTANTVTVGDDNTNAFSNTFLIAGTTQGSLGSASLLYSGSGTAPYASLAMNSNTSFVTTTHSTYTIDGSITTSGTGTLTMNGPVTMNTINFVETEAPASGLVYSGPITISDTYIAQYGNVITGNFLGTTSQPAITITTSSPVIILNANLSGPGDMVFSTGGTNVTILNTTGIATNPNIINTAKGNFIHLSHFTNMVFENNYVEGFNNGIYLLDYTGNNTPSQSMKIINNQFINTDGRYSDGAGGYLTTGTAAPHAILINQVHGIENAEVAWNKAINTPGSSYVTDIINFFESSGTSTNPVQIHDNYLQGIYTIVPGTGSNSGVGIISDGTASDTAATASAWLNIYNNYVVSGANAGIGITAGNNITVHDNTVLSSGYIADGTFIPTTFGNGLMNYNLYLQNTSTVFYNNYVSNNVSGWIRKNSATGTAMRSDAYLVGQTASFAASGNTSWLPNNSSNPTRTDEANLLTLWNTKRSNPVTSAAAQTYNGAVTLSGNAVLNAGAGAITFNSTVDGSNTLALTSTSGSALNGTVGGSTALTLLTLSGGGTDSIGGASITTSLSQIYNNALSLTANTAMSANAIYAATNISGTGSLTLNGGGLTAAGTISNAIILGAAATFSTSSSLTLNGTLTGAGNSLLLTGSAITLGGTINNVSTLKDYAASLSLNNAAISSTGLQLYTSPLTLQASTSALTSGSTITFSSGITGNFGLSASATSGTTIGSTISIGSLSLSGGSTDQINTTSITTTGAQTYSDAVTLGNALTLTSGTLTMAAVSMGANILTINTSAADSSITGIITGSAGLKFNTVDTTSGTLTFSGNNTYSGGTTIGSSNNTPSNKLIVTSTSGLGTGTATVNFNSTLNLNTGGTTTNNLILNGYGIGGSSSGIGALLGSGTSTVSGQVTLNRDSVNTFTSQADTAIGVTSGDTLTITGKITDLALNKNFIKVGNGTLVLSNAQATANSISNGSGSVVTTVSAGTLEITNTTALASSSSSVWSPVSVSYGATFRMNISTQGSYSGTPVSTVQNQIRLFGYGVDSTGAAGTSSTGLGALQGTGTSIYNVLSTGGVILGNNTTTTHSNANDTYISVPNSTDVLSITGAITDSSANKSFTKIGSGKLSISGANRLTNSTNSVHTVVSAGTLEVTSSTALLNEAATSGYFVDVSAASTLAFATSNASFVNPLNLAGTVTNSNTNTLSGNITLTSSSSPVISSASGGTLTLAGTINGTGALTLSGAGTISLSGIIGGTSAPTSLTGNVTQTSINTTGITTSGAQTYNNAVSLGASGVTTLTSTGASGITFNSTVDGSQGLKIANGSGTVTFGNRVGNTSHLASLFIGTGDPVTLNTDLVYTTGNQTYGSAITDIKNSNLTLVTGSFTNSLGSTLLTLQNGFNFQIWSTTPASDSRNSMSYDFKQYSATYGVSTVQGSGNGFFYSAAQVFTPSLSSVSKVYDSTTAATLSNGNYSASGTLSDGDVVTFNSSATGSYNNKNAGSGKTVSVSGISIASVTSNSAPVYGYTLGSTTASGAVGTITPFDLTVTATGVNRVYDTGTTATVSLSDNHFSGDNLITTYTTAAFADKNAGTGKNVSVSGISISGTDAGNYNLTGTTASTTATISKANLTVSASGINRAYDATTAATVTLSDNRLSGDILTASYSASFADKNVGTGKTVSVSDIGISGTDADNYSLTGTTVSTTANISKADLAISASGINRTYDSTTTATVTLSDNRFSSDVLTTSYSASFADKNVGTGKTVSVSDISISGTDADNYNLLNTTDSTTANISKANLTVSASGVNRSYDSTTAATVTLSDNRFSGDDLTDSYTSASFADKNAANSKSVSVSGISVSGTDLSNYTVLNTTTSTIANITPRPLNLSGSRFFDGTPTVNASTLTPGNLYSGDTVNLSGSATVSSSAINTYTAFTSNSLASGNSNYAVTGGTLSYTINPLIDTNITSFASISDLGGILSNNVWTLVAQRSISINSSLNLNSNELVLIAGTTQNGSITLGSGVVLAASSISLTAGTGSYTGSIGTSTTPLLTSTASLNAAANGNVYINNTGSVDITGLSAGVSGTASLTATGAITQSAGIINVPTLTVTSTGGMTLNRNNTITTLTPVNNGSGNISITDASTSAVTLKGGINKASQGGISVVVPNTSIAITGGLSVTSTSTTGISLSAGSNISQQSTLNAAHSSIALVAGTNGTGNILVTRPYSFNTQTLSLTTGSTTGSIGLANNLLLTPASTISATAANNIYINNNNTGTTRLASLSAGNAIGLSTSGTLSQNSGDSLSASTLTLTTQNGMNLSAGTNHITGTVTLNNQGTGNISFTNALPDSSSSLTVNGANAVRTGTFDVTETTGGLNLGTLTTNKGNFTISAAKDVNFATNQALKSSSNQAIVTNVTSTTGNINLNNSLLTEGTLNFNAGGAINLNSTLIIKPGSNYSTTANLTATGAVNVNSAFRLNSSSAIAQACMKIISGSTVTFNAATATGYTYGNVTVTTPDVIQMNVATFTTTNGNQNWAGTLQLNTNTTFTAKNITLKNVNAASRILYLRPTGTATVSGADSGTITLNKLYIHGGKWVRGTSNKTPTRN